MATACDTLEVDLSRVDLDVTWETQPCIDVEVEQTDITIEAVTVANQGPPGPVGPEGPQGNQGAAGPPGPQGLPGAAATVAAGATVTSAPGTSANVTNSGSSSAAVFDFSIPRGDVGAIGPTGPQGAQGNPGPTGPQGIQGPQGPSGAGTGDMLKSVYDVNGDNIVDQAAAVPWTGVTGKPSTFAPSAHGTTHLDNGTDVVPVVTTARTGLAPKLSGSATTYLDGTGAYSAPPGTAGNMLKSVYDTNADNIVDQAAAAPWAGITGKPSTFPPDATAELVARKGAANGYPSLDATTHVPITQLPAPTSGNASTTQLVKGDDTRLSDARTPTAHAPSHVTGSDQIVSAGAGTKGLLNQLSGNTTDFVDGTNNCQPLALQIWSTRLRSFSAAGNPNFSVDQRNVGLALTNPNGFIMDRWAGGRISGTMGISMQQGVGTFTSPILVPGTSFAISSGFLRIQLTAQQTTLGASDQVNIYQTLEGIQTRELCADVTSLQVLVRSSVAGLNFGLVIRDGGATRSLTKLATITSANTWQLLTFPNLPVFSSSGSFPLTPGNIGAFLTVSLACGSTPMSPANDTWQNGNFTGALGQSNFAAQPVNSTFDIAFVQWEPGAVCSTLIDKPFSVNLDECLRYYQKTFGYTIKPGTASSPGACLLWQPVSSANFLSPISFFKPMAKIPTLTIYDVNTGAANSYSYNGSSATAVTSIVNLGDSGYSGFVSGGAPAAGSFAVWNHTADTGW